MDVTKISASIRYSFQVEGGGWLTAELGAEATLTPEESLLWPDHQATLYTDLRTVLADQVRNAKKKGGDAPTPTPPTEADPPASAKQLGYLKRLGITPKPHLTQGEASQWIDQALAQKRRGNAHPEHEERKAG